MDIQFRTRGLNTTASLRVWLEQPLERLRNFIPVSTAEVVLERHRDSAPAFRAHMQSMVNCSWKATRMKHKLKRDVEKVCSTTAFVARLRRLADALEAGQPFSIRVARERVAVPALAIFSIEHERDAAAEELEFQLKWKRKPKPGQT